MLPSKHAKISRAEREAQALAADMRELEAATGAATEADLIARGWPPKRLQSLAPAAREILSEARHG